MGGDIFRTYPGRPLGPPSLLYNGRLIFPGVKSGRGATLTPHPLLVPWSRMSRAIPPLRLGPYGLHRASVPVQGCTKNKIDTDIIRPNITTIVYLLLIKKSIQSTDDIYKGRFYSILWPKFNKNHRFMKSLTEGNLLFTIYLQTSHRRSHNYRPQKHGNGLWFTLRRCISGLEHRLTVRVVN